jgi:hypothetical protein
VGGERTKMNAQNKQSLKDSLKRISDHSLSIIYSISDHNDENWIAAYKTHQEAHQATKMLERSKDMDYKTISQSEAWGEYAENRQIELN